MTIQKKFLAKRYDKNVKTILVAISDEGFDLSFSLFFSLTESKE